MSEDLELINEQLLESSAPKKIEYRVYFDDEGNVLKYSSGDFPTEGQFINITKEQYDKALYSDIAVINGQLISIVPTYKFRVQLTKSTEGYRTAKGHAGILDENNELSDIEYFQKNLWRGLGID